MLDPPSDPLARATDVLDTHRLVVEHIKRIRQIPRMEGCTIVLCLESNLAFESQHLVHAVQKASIQRWIVMQEGAKNTMGWLTTNERKESMCLQLREALRIGSIAFAPSFVSVTSGEQDAKKTLVDEMMNFSVIVEAPKTPFAKARSPYVPTRQSRSRSHPPHRPPMWQSRKTYTGKVGGRQDDLVIATQLAITSMRWFYQSDRYRSFR